MENRKSSLFILLSFSGMNMYAIDFIALHRRHLRAKSHGYKMYQVCVPPIMERKLVCNMQVRKRGYIKVQSKKRKANSMAWTQSSPPTFHQVP